MFLDRGHELHAFLLLNWARAHQIHVPMLSGLDQPVSFNIWSTLLSCALLVLKRFQVLRVGGLGFEL